MNPWGYIALGVGLAVVAGVLFGIAQPSDLDYALAASERSLYGSADRPGANGGLMLAGFIAATAGGILTLIGVIGEGVRIGNRESD